MPASIHSLPVEILSSILEFASDSLLRPAAVPEQRRRDSYAFLANSALVCRAWRGPSQATLWLHVELARQTNAFSFFRAQRTLRLATRTLVLHLEGMGATGESVLKVVLGVKSLTLEGGWIPPARLSTINLSSKSSGSRREERR